MKKRFGGVAGIIALAVSIFFVGCGKDSGNTGTGTDANKDFKIAMLTNYADNLIIPAYTDLQSKLDVLNTAVEAFLASPSTSTQASLKTSFKNAYLSFEGISVPNFGPAAVLLVNNYSNTFPAAINDVESGILSGTYNFAQPIASDSIQGFPTLDYLLFSTDAVTKFSAPDAANRKKYVQDVMARLKSLVSSSITQWTGTYKTAFVNSTKTDVGSSIGYLINQFAFEMDALKGPRIGWPYGKQSGGIVFADKCEAYFSGISADLAVANLASLKNYYKGGSGSGIDDYLILLNKNQLNADVLAQFDLALTALQAIPSPMSEAFTNNKPLIDAAYIEIQKLLTLLKTDVASATSVRINYQDSDGD
ncbi:imelysin family protein [Ferruginibacter sp. SUN002]|uniref:imelysin family protein n=1 Tax=Ferruginibacter sp. SUN002 TaxID=2937789 RepID=UPI003D36A746